MKYELGISKYLEYFNLWNFENGNYSNSDVQFGEATPYYIASRHACSRISKTLPYIKLIILMRNPTSRAYSEYNMKFRYIFIHCINIYIYIYSFYNNFTIGDFNHRNIS
jgi:hypothetical protein